MKKTILAVTAICLAAVLLCGAGCYAAVNYIDRHPAEAAPSLSTPAPAPADAEGLKVSTLARASAGGELSATEIYQLACKQVVGISTTVTGYNMFGQLTKNAVSGTGFIISEDGYILTNNHVVEGAKDVTVKLNDGSEYAAEIVGVEGRDSDVAVLKIETSGLTPVTLGNSDAMEVGENIYVVGNPLGELTYTMTSGIISALDREIAADRNTTLNMFQLDAAVNSGNSGGPVFNDRGQVIGVVTAKYNASGVEGLGFAIPVSDVAPIASDLITKGYVTGKAYMGVWLDERYSAMYAQYYNMPLGAYVSDVSSGSCAEKAGIQRGDVITRIGETELSSYSELKAAVKKFSAGDTTEVELYRAGESMVVTITFDEAKPESA